MWMTRRLTFLPLPMPIVPFPQNLRRSLGPDIGVAVSFEGAGKGGDFDWDLLCFVASVSTPLPSFHVSEVPTLRHRHSGLLCRSIWSRCVVATSTVTSADLYPRMCVARFCGRNFANLVQPTGL